MLTVARAFCYFVIPNIYNQMFAKMTSSAASIQTLTDLGYAFNEEGKLRQIDK